MSYLFRGYVDNNKTTLITTYIKENAGETFCVSLCSYSLKYFFVIRGDFLSFIYNHNHDGNKGSNCSSVQQVAIFLVKFVI